MDAQQYYAGRDEALGDAIKPVADGIPISASSVNNSKVDIYFSRMDLSAALLQAVPMGNINATASAIMKTFSKEIAQRLEVHGGCSVGEIKNISGASSGDASNHYKISRGELALSIKLTNPLDFETLRTILSEARAATIVSAEVETFKGYVEQANTLVASTAGGADALEAAAADGWASQIAYEKQRAETRDMSTFENDEAERNWKQQVRAAQAYDADRPRF